MDPSWEKWVEEIEKVLEELSARLTKIEQHTHAPSIRDIGIQGYR